MKVDVYPNITNVEVYENPISVPVEATWEKVTFTVPNPVVSTFDLGREVATDRDGDFVLQVTLDGVNKAYGTDFTFSGSVLTWVNANPLTVDAKLVVWYSPKSAYGSVPGSGEVTSLTHLNDVTITGGIAGQLLVKDGNGQFINRFLTAGSNMSIVSDANAVTLTSNPNLPMSLLTESVSAEVQKSYLMNTSASALTVTLPNVAALGDTIQVSRFGAEALTVARNGHKINGADLDLSIVDLNGVVLRYADPTIGWFQVI
jgi:hypothetical protein